MSEWPDVEAGVRDYLRADTAVQAIVRSPGGTARVFFGIPQNARFPLVVVRRVGGGRDAGETPIDRALIAVDCWGPGVRAGQLPDGAQTGQGKPNKASARALTAAVRDALDAIRSETLLNATCAAYGAEVVADIWAPDPDDDRPRYTLTVDVTARAIAA